MKMTFAFCSTFYLLYGAILLLYSYLQSRYACGLNIYVEYQFILTRAIYGLDLLPTVLRLY
jgi:hypothetical protein